MDRINHPQIQDLEFVKKYKGEESYWLVTLRNRCYGKITDSNMTRYEQAVRREGLLDLGGNDSLELTDYLEELQC